MQCLVLRQRTSLNSQLIHTTSSKLRSFQEQLTQLNGGHEINVKSPRQVSHAIFGRFQSTSKQTLLQAPLDERRRTMANIVLQMRELSKTAEKNTKFAKDPSLEPILEVEDDFLLPKANFPEASALPSSKSSYDLHVESLFHGRSSRMDPCWKEPMLKLTKPSSRNMVLQFTPDCPFGYNPQATPFGTSTSGTTTAGKQGTLLHFCREQKMRYSHCIVLTRVGDFYESFGVDAALLVEHCGLNPMGGKGRAGCPINNVQATLDDLTQLGYSVAVVEEVSETNSERRPSTNQNRLKARMLGQIVSPANPTYLHDLLLKDNAVLFDALPSRPYVAILSRKSGATYMEVSVEERTIRVSSGLTSEAVGCRLMAYPPAEPVVYVGTSKPHLKLRTVTLPLDLLPEKEPEKGLLKQLLQRIEGEELVSDNFRWTTEEQRGVNPLYVETATQLGLMNDPSIPSMIDALLPESAPAATKRFMRKWLLIPPPVSVSESMAIVVQYLQDKGRALPPLSVPPVGKVVALLRAGQASAKVYSDLLAAIDATLLSLVELKQLHQQFMMLLQHQSGIASTVESLKTRCLEAKGLIENVISPTHLALGNVEDTISDYGDLVPKAFFERNEATWRGRVRSQAAPAAYATVEAKALELAVSVASDFWGFNETDINRNIETVRGKKSPIFQDIFDNMIAVKEVAGAGHGRYIRPTDRFGKPIGNRLTTLRVQTALSEYVDACENACLEVTLALTQLSQRMCDEGHLPAVVQAAHFNLILSTAAHHAAKSNVLGWQIAETYDRVSQHPSRNNAGKFVGVFPYWMDRSEAVSNSFDIDSMFLLTAPNMSGKSTLMRSTAAAALLVNCGLCAPLSSDSAIRRLDHIFVRGASADVPSENKSAFGAEMSDIAALLRCCGHDSLVFVDELGRGTSPRDGTSIAAAVLESMSTAGISGIFATHLHDIIGLPLNGSDRIRQKRMAVESDDADVTNYKWTYRIEDGVCTESLALVTAARFGLPFEILTRAASFAELLTSSHKGQVHQDENKPPDAGLNLLSDASLVSEVDGLDAACKVVGCSDTAILIPPQWRSPPSLEGTSCVYILELSDINSGRQYYVGETDSIEKRLTQHRAKGGQWSMMTAVAFTVPGGKTEARNMESLAIQRLAQAGFNLISTTDGRSIRPTGRK